MNVMLTSIAAKLLRELLDKESRRDVLEFLNRQFPDYARQHRPREIPGLDGEYWVVRPGTKPEDPAILVTKRPDTDDEYVVTAVAPHDTSAQDMHIYADLDNAPKSWKALERDISIGASVHTAAETAD